MPWAVKSFFCRPLFFITSRVYPYKVERLWVCNKAPHLVDAGHDRPADAVRQREQSYSRCVSGLARWPSYTCPRGEPAPRLHAQSDALHGASRFRRNSEGLLRRRGKRRADGGAGTVWQNTSASPNERPKPREKACFGGLSHHQSSTMRITPTTAPAQPAAPAPRCSSVILRAAA